MGARELLLRYYIRSQEATREPYIGRPGSNMTAREPLGDLYAARELKGMQLGNQ